MISLKFQKKSCYAKHLNQYRVIFIPFNELPRRCKSYEQYLDRIESNLIDDLIQAYPTVSVNPSDAVWDVLKKFTLLILHPVFFSFLMNGILFFIEIL